MKRRWPLVGLACATLASLVLSSGTAKAEYPAPKPYIGIFGGGNYQLTKWDIGRLVESDAQRVKDLTPQVGLRLGYQVLKPLALELEFSNLFLKSEAGDKNTAFHYSLNAYYHILPSDWTPYVGLGVGMFHNTSDNLGKDVDPRVHLGLGLRGLITPWMALRVEAREVMTDGMGDGPAHLLEGLAGLDFFLSGAKEAPADRDSDGVLDADDKCPDQPGTKENAGCPDRDKDGVVDSADKCPDDPGSAELQGCPDSDGDGIGDGSDECPKAPGPKETQGCPDQDKDGVNDSQDKCPELAGPPENKGCPDTDGDGVMDNEDKCPKDPGPKDHAGCPDRDNDEVIDAEDKCPDVPGLVAHQGCLPEEAKKFTGAIQGIYFDTGSAKIQPKSHTVLDKAVAVLKQYEGMRLRIEGHTDNVGKPDKNQKLSEDRAASVKAYLISKGIAEGRLESAGFGDTKPAKPNDTAANRSANRRIEFVPIGVKRVAPAAAPASTK